jgi:hypothetical protein
MKLEFSRQIFRKKLICITFYQNPSSGNRVVQCGRTVDEQMDGRKNMKKLLVASCNLLTRLKARSQVGLKIETDGKISN